jgi:hypothetical protein
MVLILPLIYPIYSNYFIVYGRMSSRALSLTNFYMTCELDTDLT